MASLMPSLNYICWERIDREGAVTYPADAPHGSGNEIMAFMPFCYAKAAANLLTNLALDLFGKIPEFKFCAVKLEKAALRSAAESSVALR